MNYPVLNNWRCKRSPCAAAGASDLMIIGNVRNHPDRPSGELVSIGTIISISGRDVTTRTRTYRLGRIQKSYRALLVMEGIDYDEREPVKFRRAR